MRWITSGAGHLAAAEARELQLATELAGLVLEPALDLLRGDLHLKAHSRVTELGDRRLQGGGHVRHDTVPADAGPHLRRRLLEARLWTGRAAHFVGGGADLARALSRHLLAAARARARVGLGTRRSLAG